MSVKIMGMVWDQDLEPNKKFVLLAYADHADHKGKNIYPAVPTIANKTGYHERSVQRITHELEDLGYMIPDGIGPNGTNKWAIPLNKGGDKIAPLTKCRGDTDSGDIPSGDKMPPESTNRHKEEEEEGETFKNAYAFFLENMGMPRSYDNELLGDMCDEHNPHWVIEAMKISVKKGARNLAYTDAILKRWKVEGYGTEKSNGNGRKSNGKNRRNNQAPEPDNFVEELEKKRERLKKQMAAGNG